jgi:hypothetical protein
MKPSFQPRSGLLAIVVVAAVGCGGAGGGCGLAPFPNNARYSGTKSDHSVAIRLSPNGINYLNTNWQQLIGMFAPGNTLTLPVGCMRQNVAVVGDVTIADQGNAAGTGRMDGQCNANDLPAQVQATITGFNLTPQAPDRLQATISVSIATGKIYARTNNGNSVLCLFLSSAACSIDFNTARSAPNTNTITAQVRFSIDTKWDKLLAFEVVTPIQGTGICGSQPCLQPSDLDISGENTCGDIWCGLADWDPVKNLLLQALGPTLQTQIANAIAAQSCESCGTGLPACPTVGTATSSCVSGKCMDMSVTPNKCVPRFLGVEGRVALSSLLGGFGVPATAALDLSLAAGSPVNPPSQIVDQGINLGMRGGLKAVAVAPCVAPVAAPALSMVNPPNFDDPAIAPSGYHVGLGISQPFMQLAFHEAQQSGALCIQVNSSTVGLINTGLFKTFLPSLGRLATRDGLDAPMMVVLRPARPPTVKVGLGTFDPVTKKPIKPLLEVGLPDLSIDFYAMIDERYARLFTLTADISLPLSLIFTGCDTVSPALGDLKTLITNIRTANSEMLAEDPKVLADLIPAVIGLAEPALTGALSGFDLPQLGQFKLKVNKTTGLSQITGTENYNHLGIYATLLPLNGVCAVASPTTAASLKQSIMPKAEQMRLVGQPLPWPSAILDVRALGGSGTPEFAYRIDDGMWSTFLAANEKSELEVTHPVFLIQGQHQIEVRSRYAEDAHGVSTPVKLGFLVDWEPPEVNLALDREADRITVAANDVITPAAALQYSYAVGSDAFSDFGAPREIMLSAVEQLGGVTVRVRDEMGNVGEAKWKVPVVALRPEGSAADPVTGPAAGCASAAGLPIAGLALALASLLRRRRK